MPVDYRPVFAAVGELSTLGDGWDSYGGRAPTTEAMAAARGVLFALRDVQPAVVPTSNGGVQFEWHAGGVDLELEIGPEGEQVFDEKTDGQK